MLKKDNCTVLPGEWNVRDAIPETERYTEIRMMEQRPLFKKLQIK